MYDPEREELVTIVDDASPDEPSAANVYRTGMMADPSGSGLVGHASQLRLTENALGHPFIRYKDFLIEADVYKDPASDALLVLIVCPLCRNKLTIRSQQKAISFEPQTVLDRATGKLKKRGRISIEPFKCTWEKGRGTDATKDDRMLFGVGLCNWKVGVDNNLARDA